ncbi:C6 finger domain-containing protein (putative fungal zinc cluster transcription factor) [Paramyrothecium foliicola]|nr:C6 finger domain-containing protein (putative fungal zinc cluster transcription factor) [Paramyrothecium foliicola]
MVTTNRIRTVEGSCWPCRRRRIKCDLNKPQCTRCAKIGAQCDFSARRLRWCTRPTTKAPAIYQITTRDEQLAATLAIDEKRALDYFHHRLWPLLTTAAEPCAAPILQALENRVVLLATCVIADAHRVLQDGRNSSNLLRLKRLECLAAVRGGIGGVQIDAIEKESLMTLLLAVLLLYFHDGYLECAQLSASTSSHHGGVQAIVNSLGGINTVLETSHESIHMLLSEFASTDLTTIMLKGGQPSFPPDVWDTIDKRSVWWGPDVPGQSSLASVFKQTAKIAWYLEGLKNGTEELSMTTIPEFEASLSPVYARITDMGVTGGQEGDHEAETNNAITLIRSFQHTALIYTYRAICNLPISHTLVQQHVLPCLECILEIKRPSKVLNCVIFPLLVAGAHVQSARHQKAVLNLVHVIRDEMRFASFHYVVDILSSIWKSDQADVTWFEMFSELGPDAIVL